MFEIEFFIRNACPKPILHLPTFRLKSRLQKLRCGEARAYSDSWQATQNSDGIHVLDKMPAASTSAEQQIFLALT